MTASRANTPTREGIRHRFVLCPRLEIRWSPATLPAGPDLCSAGVNLDRSTMADWVGAHVLSN